MDRKIKSRQLGINLVEIVILLAIIFILLYVLKDEYLNYLAKARLREALNQLLSDLNYIKTQAQITGAPWGIRACANTSRYKIFIDHDGNCRDSNIYCNASNSIKVCLVNPSQGCTSDADCPGNFPGACRMLEEVKELPKGIIFAHSTYLLFDKKGFPFDYSCGLGMGNFTFATNGTIRRTTITIYVDKLGRVRVE